MLNPDSDKAEGRTKIEAMIRLEFLDGSSCPIENECFRSSLAVLFTSILSLPKVKSNLSFEFLCHASMSISGSLPAIHPIDL